MRDINAAVVAFLKSAVNGVADRVYSHELPTSPTFPAIVVRDVLGASDTGYLPEGRERVDRGAPTDSGYLAASHSRVRVDCYGDVTLDDAKATWVAAHEALKSLVRGAYDGTLLLSAVRVDGPVTAVESGNPVSGGEFVVLAAALPVS